MRKFSLFSFFFSLLTFSFLYYFSYKEVRARSDISAIQTIAAPTDCVQNLPSNSSSVEAMSFYDGMRPRDKSASKQGNKGDKAKKSTQGEYVDKILKQSKAEKKEGQGNFRHDINKTSDSSEKNKDAPRVEKAEEKDGNSIFSNLN